MPTFVFDYIPQDGGETLFPLTPRQRDHLKLSLREIQARTRLLMPDAPQEGKGKRTPKPSPETQAQLQQLQDRALLLEMELLNDALLRSLHADRVRTARFKPEPSDGLKEIYARAEASRLARQLRASLSEEGEVKTEEFTPETEDLIHFEAAYRTLNPVPVEGWEGEIPPYLRFLIGGECHRELFPGQYRNEIIAVFIMNHEEKKAAEEAA